MDTKKPLRRLVLGGLVLSVVALSSVVLVLGIASRVWGQNDWQRPNPFSNPFNIPSPGDPEPNNGFGGGAYVQEPVLPSGLNVFNLSLEQTRQYSKSYNYEVVGHTYFHGFEKYETPAAIAAGQGAGFNTPRVYDGIGYFGGAGFYAVIIADVHDPQNMVPLSAVPCDPGTRCLYIRVDPVHHILVIPMDATTGGASNPIQPAGGCKLSGSGAGSVCSNAVSGVAFYDVSNPRKPVRLSFFPTGTWSPDGPVGTDTARATHGLDLDGRYAYVCIENGPTKLPENGLDMSEMTFDYSNPSHPVVVSSYHVTGQFNGETFAPNNQLNPDGTPQLPYCHEVNYYNNYLYMAYRDAGPIILDVTNRADPKVVEDSFDYVPPYNGGSLGASHTFMPVGMIEWESQPPNADHPTIAINTDENFGCPPGFGRVLDLTDMNNVQLLATYQIPISSENYDRTTQTWTCLAGQQTSHLPWFDQRSASLFHQAWYRHGVRAWNIQNPYQPQEIGYYLSPPYAGASGRVTREVWQDPTTNLIWATDGDGGGVTVLRYTGPIPPSPPIPGAR
jgi:LVIVD repeat